MTITPVGAPEPPDTRRHRSLTAPVGTITLPFLFVNGRAYQTFRLNPEVRRYDSQLGFVVDVEIGYEFKGKKSETVATQPVEAAPTSESTPATDPAAQPQPTP